MQSDKPLDVHIGALFLTPRRNSEQIGANPPCNMAEEGGAEGESSRLVSINEDDTSSSELETKSNNDENIVGTNVRKLPLASSSVQEVNKANNKCTPHEHYEPSLIFNSYLVVSCLKWVVKFDWVLGKGVHYTKNCLKLAGLHFTLLLNQVTCLYS